jgi:glycosyltransferase involved in cell wall biosynthesis
MIAIPVLTLVPGVVGGSEVYVRELLRSLARVGEHEYLALLPPIAADASDGPRFVVADEYLSARTVPRRLAAIALATARPAPLRAHLEGADVVHYPLTIALPRMACPTVVTLHDVQHLDLPTMFPRAERAFRAAFWQPALRRADRVIVLSEFVKERAVARIGLDPARIRVVPQGVDHETLMPGDGEREPFLLYPARSWPHKNHARLFEAFATLRRERPELRLVLTGGGDFSDAPVGVESRGYVGKAELVALMQRASALVFPSLYEGFGLPPLEAMACGCPVACSDAAALPEVVGDAARLFDPNDASAIAAAVRNVLNDPAPWVERGLARAQQFSWDATARATDAVYGELSTRS